MDVKLEAEIIKTCECIGFLDEENKYIADPQWEPCVRDLIIFLRRDDDDNDKSIRRLLGKTQVLARDLVPLVKQYHKNPLTWEVTLRLLDILTEPAFVLYDGDIPKTDKKNLNHYHQLEGYLRSYKAAFVDNVLWKIIAEKLRELLAIDYAERTTKIKLVIERLFILLRNILHVAADPAEERRADDDATLHDRLLMVLHLSGMYEILLHAMANTPGEYSILYLEIMSLMFREQTGEQLAKTEWTRNEEDKVKDERELIQMREKEAVLKNIQLQKIPTRHSRFGGTFVVQNMKASSGNDILCHKPITSLADLNLDGLKKRKKVASNRRPISDGEVIRRSTVPVRIILKNFCASFLQDDKYNRLMSTVKDFLNRSNKKEYDETYYLWGMKFFMEFNRYHEFQANKVSETMSTNAFHYVQTLLTNSQDMMATDKPKIQLWSKRSHFALKAYQELLFTLLWMDKQGIDDRVLTKSRNIKTNVFYLPEYRELLHSLLNNYEPVKFSKAYLKDLIETNHLFLKMLEDYASSSRKIMVQTKAKKKKPKKDKKSASKKIVKAKPMTPEELEEGWENISENVSTTLSDLKERTEGEEITASIEENVIPFDAASDTPIDDQKDTALARIAAFLHTDKFKEAVLLLRASREVWPTDPEYFGETEVSTEEEVLLLKSIYVEKASLKRVLEARTALLNPGAVPSEEERPEIVPEPLDEEERERAAVIGGDSEDDQGGHRDEEDDEDEDEEEEESRHSGREQEFDFKGFVNKYASARIACNYALLFQDWDTLKPLTLHCILKMFHRFVFDMGLPAMICQASVFLTFKKILLVADHRSDLKEVKGFFSHFWPKFVKLCDDKKMFIEILFWKTAREAQEIQDGWADLQGGKSKSKKSEWSKDEDTELELLVDLYKDSPDEVKKAQSLLAFIMQRWTWRAKKKRVFLNRLIEKNLADASELEEKKKKRPPKTWSEEEVSRLRELYEEHKGSDDIMGSILTLMEIKRSKKSVIEKMIELELISDKSQVKKKRQRGSKKKSKSQNAGGSDSENETERAGESRIERGSRSGSDSSSSGSESESDEETETGNNLPSLSAGAGSFDEERACEIGKRLMSTGDMTGVLTWFRTQLQNFLEDLMDDPDSDESTPLVPVNTSYFQAFRDTDFKRFLKQFGINPPGQQEQYWRIPSYFKKRDIEIRLDALEKVLSFASSGENEATADATTRNEETASVVSSVIHKPSQSKTSKALRVDSDSDPELPEITSNLPDSDSELPLPLIDIGAKIPESDSDSDSDNESNVSKRPPPKKKISKRRVVLRDDSDSDSDRDEHSLPPINLNLKDDEVASTVTSIRPPAKSKRAILHDSDSEDEETRDVVTNENDYNDDTISTVTSINPIPPKSGPKRAILDDSDSDKDEVNTTTPGENEKTKKVNQSESLEKEDDSTTIRKVSKRKRVVLEEDSEDDAGISSDAHKSKKLSRIDSDSDS